MDAAAPLRSPLAEHMVEDGGVRHDTTLYPSVRRGRGNVRRTWRDVRATSRVGAGGSTSASTPWFSNAAALGGVTRAPARGARQGGALASTRRPVRRIRRHRTSDRHARQGRATRPLLGVARRAHARVTRLWIVVPSRHHDGACPCLPPVELVALPLVARQYSARRRCQEANVAAR